MLLVRPVHDQALCQVLTNTHTQARTLAPLSLLLLLLLTFVVGRR